MPDILIRMEMPTSCGRCRFAGVCGVHPVDEWPDLESIITNDVIGVDGERDKGCPLVELPPHGDLIDADSLANDLLYDAELAGCALDDTTLVGKEREYLQSEKDIKQNCAYYVKNSPIIVPASKEDTPNG